MTAPARCIQVEFFGIPRQRTGVAVTEVVVSEVSQSAVPITDSVMSAFPVSPQPVCEQPISELPASPRPLAAQIVFGHPVAEQPVSRTAKRESPALSVLENQPTESTGSTRSLPDGKLDLATLLGILAQRFPDFGRECVTDGQLRTGYLANLNGERFVADPRALLQVGDCLLIMTADAGG